MGLILLKMKSRHNGNLLINETCIKGKCLVLVLSGLYVRRLCYWINYFKKERDSWKIRHREHIAAKALLKQQIVIWNEFELHEAIITTAKNICLLGHIEKRRFFTMRRALLGPIEIARNNVSNEVTALVCRQQQNRHKPTDSHCWACVETNDLNDRCFEAFLKFCSRGPPRVHLAACWRGTFFSSSPSSYRRVLAFTAAAQKGESDRENQKAGRHAEDAADERTTHENFQLFTRQKGWSALADPFCLYKLARKD